MGMQRVPLQKEFYEARYVGSCWQMPSMQKYGVQTCSVSVLLLAAEPFHYFARDLDL